MEQKCSICKRGVDSETAAILTVGGFGNVKYLCSECDAELSEATGGRDLEKINLALDNIGKKLTATNNDDGFILSTLKEIMKDAEDRARKIEAGEYDFCEDEVEEEEIPEELRETEEDKALDKKDAEVNKKVDTVMNWVCLAVVLATVGFFIYKMLDTFFF